MKRILIFVLKLILRVIRRKKDVEADAWIDDYKNLGDK